MRKFHSNVLILTILLAIHVACSKREDTISASTPPVPTASESVTSTPTIDGIATEEARNCFQAVALQKGDSWLTQSNDGLAYRWTEYNNPQFTVMRSSTAADKLNGYDYRGHVRMIATARRSVMQAIGPETATWSPWNDGRGQIELEFEITQARGNWSCSGLENYSRPDFAKMPPLPN